MTETKIEISKDQAKFFIDAGFDVETTTVLHVIIPNGSQPPSQLELPVKKSKSREAKRRHTTPKTVLRLMHIPKERIPTTVAGDLYKWLYNYFEALGFPDMTRECIKKQILEAFKDESETCMNGRLSDVITLGLLVPVEDLPDTH